MVLANATIYTADPARPFADAMAVRDGRVLRVGTYESVKVASVDASLVSTLSHPLHLSSSELILCCCLHCVLCVFSGAQRPPHA
jgi:hypothetical protein